MRKFSLLESFKYSDEEIEDFFMEYIDDKQFSLESGFLTKDNRFFTDVAHVDKNTKQCKHIKINLPDIAKGIQGNSGGGRALTSIDLLTKPLNTIKMFYARSGEQPNFYLETRWEDISIHFYVVGGLVETSHIETKGEIRSLLDDLVPILKNRGYKRVSIKNDNWLEIRTTAKKVNGWPSDYLLRDIIHRAIGGQLTQDDRNQPLIDWCQKVIQLNYNISYGGGDNQVVIQLKKL